MNPPEQLSAARRRRMQVRLLAWFDKYRRELPWRNSRDPYRIWVSEVMLQQTTVKAVTPLFLQFVERFPTLKELANASEQEVLHAWQGLGYYRRARWLHQAARQIMADFEGEFPATPETLELLPGIGLYTRNAILSQAFDQRLPIVEANTLRVLTRLQASRLDPKSGAGAAWLWNAAEELLPKARCGDWNQALMELGAIVCTVKAPNCLNCPLRKDCVARTLGVVSDLPVASKRAHRIEEREVGLLVRSPAGFLIVQLPAKARRWGTMWTIPTRVVAEGASELDAANALATELGLKSPALVPHGKLSYIVTRHRITLTLFAVHKRSPKINLAAWPDHRWIDSKEANQYPMSTHQRRLFTDL
jgi:A/G-specific adenine glycosylase